MYCRCFDRHDDHLSVYSVFWYQSSGLLLPAGKDPFHEVFPQQQAPAFVGLYPFPGSPKDIMTYVLGLTNMKLSVCLLITSIARIPSVITSTIGGNALGIQDYQFAIIAFIFTIVVSVTGILIYRHMSKRLNERQAAADAAAEQPLQLEQAEGKSQVIAMAAENSQVDDEHELSDCANLSGKEQ